MAPQLLLGNTAKPYDAKRHSWTFYVRGATHLVREVIVLLHPTFRDPVRKLVREPFELKSRGWGTFTLDVTLAWKCGGELKTTWELQFDHPDASCAVEVPAAILAASSAFAATEASAAEPPSKRRSAAGGGGMIDACAALPPPPLPPPLEPPAEATSDWPEDDSAGGDDGDDDSDDDPAAPPAAGGAAAGAATPRPALPAPRSARSAEAATAAVAEVDEVLRSEVCGRLASAAFLQPKDPLFMHGRAYIGPSLPPTCTWRSDRPPRDDHEAPKWLTASEFRDERETLEAKTRQLAQLLRLSKKTVAYTGAGISASVIGQAARSGENRVGWKPDTRRAKPTMTHHVLGFLGRQNLIHSWVQQNHDGLPQKAGFPQERINEIHGSWYDPSNPVVKYSGSLHDRAFPWMEHDAATADLVLVLGTSLGGLNADQVATGAADRSRRQNGALGTVCINLQQTEQDGKMSLRLFGKSDEILQLLLRELGLPEPPTLRGAPAWPAESRALVPYDAKGRRAEKGPRMWLDLSDGQRIRITPGHNIQGARQPMYMHIGARKPIKTKSGTRQPAEGLGRVDHREDDTGSFRLNIEGAQMRLGIWWLEAAIRGAVEVLPIVNQRPAFEQ